MNWIKENTFAAGLLLVAFAAIIGTYLFAGSRTKAFDESKAAFDASASRYTDLARIQPFPSAANLEARRKDVVAYRGQVEGLQKALLTYRPEKFEKIRPGEFTTRINEVGKALKASYTTAGIAYPEKWQLGFETYTSSPPRDGATDFLNYQLSAFDWLYQSLAKSGLSELLNVYRTKLPVEDGKPMGGGQQGGKGKQRSNNAGSAKPYYVLPVELTFKGREASLRKFLEELANSKEYFFVVRNMRVQNQRAEAPPKKSDANFKAEVAPAADDAGDPFAGFDFVIPGEEGDDTGIGDDVPEGEDDAIEPSAPEVNPQDSGEQILGQVLGAEEVFVFLQLELLLFRDNVALPEVQ